MLPSKDRKNILENASAEIEAVCKKHGVVLHITDGDICVHHGQWSEGSADYSAYEMKLSKDCHL